MKKEKSTFQGVFDFANYHPTSLYPERFPAQETAYPILKKGCEKRARNHGFTMKAPTGSGKSIIGYTFLKTLAEKMKKNEIPKGLLIYITPKLDLIKQLENMFPGEVIGIRGRAYYPCIKYQEQGFNAGQVPQTICKTCPHRVRQETGKVLEENVEPCLYYDASYRAKQATITVCSDAFFILTQLNHVWEKPVGLVVDEGHKLPDMAQLTLSSNISEWHLGRCIHLMESFNRPELASDITFLKNFQTTMTEIIKNKPMVENGNRERDSESDASRAQQALLTEEEIRTLLDVLRQMDGDAMNSRVQKLIAEGVLDGATYLRELQQLEVIGKEMKRYAASFGYALPTEERSALNYICSYSLPDEEANRRRTSRKLMVCHWYVAGLLKQITDVPFFLNLSATFGDPKVYSYQSGIKNPFHAFPSTFPSENRRYYLPTNTLDLTRSGSDQNKARSYTRAAVACGKFAEYGIRGVVIVVSKQERTDCLDIMRRHKVNVLTAGEDANAIQRFKDGEGQVLLGLSAHLTEGVDLPGKMAQYMIVLRPGFPVVGAPATQFEIQRLGDTCWGAWMHRVKIEFEQASGRIFRGPDDKGVVICLASGYDRIVRPAVPDEFQSCIVDTMKFDECIQDAIDFLLNK